MAPPARLPAPGDGDVGAARLDPLGLVAGDAASAAGFCAGPPPAVDAWDAQAALDDLRVAQAADHVYALVDALADAMRTPLAALAGAAEFRPWVRADPTFKPRLSGFPLDCTGRSERDHSLGHWRDALLHLRTPCGGTRPATLWPARATLGRDCGCRRAAGAGAAGPGAPQPGRRAPRVDVRLPDGPGRGRRPNPRLGLDLKPRPAASLPGGAGGSSFWACTASVGPPSTRGSSPAGDPLHGDRPWRVPPPPSPDRPR